MIRVEGKFKKDHPITKKKKKRRKRSERTKIRENKAEKSREEQRGQG